jgi:hypothetical protein
MIKLIKQDIIDGEILDTTIKIDIEITISGQEYENFKKELNEVINKYHI